MRGREDFPPYPFWLNARYELGMDLALLVVVLMVFSPTGLLGLADRLLKPPRKSAPTAVPDAAQATAPAEVAR